MTDIENTVKIYSEKVGETMKLTGKQERLYVKLSSRWDKDNETPWNEAEHLARLYLRAKTFKEQEDIIQVTRLRGGDWDGISRSTSYYPIFEKEVGRRFYQFWAKTPEEFERQEREIEEMNRVRR